MVGLTCTLMATWEGLFSCVLLSETPPYRASDRLTEGISVFILGLTNGGPAGLVYGFIICWIGTIGLYCSLAEMASA